MSNNDNNSNGFQPRDMSGVLFYDAPGAPTLKGNVLCNGQKIDIMAEPAVDKNQKSYTRITGNSVSGALYDNENKKEDRHPSYTGPIQVNGQKLRVSAWIKQTKRGENAGSNFLSLALSEPMKKQN